MNDICLKIGDKIALVACSNAIPKSDRHKIDRLCDILRKMGLHPMLSDYIFAKSGVYAGTPQQRAYAVNRFFADNSIKMIFDISGGDLANEILPYLDYDIIKRSGKLFVGISDLTSVINAIYHKTGAVCGLYRLKGLYHDENETQRKIFENSLIHGDDSILKADWRFVQGSRICGTVIGGNLRCLLKLAGTPYMPDFDGKVLFLESYMTDVSRTAAYMAQLKQMGVFDRISGLMLGTFTQMQRDNLTPSAEQLAVTIADNPNLPIAKTENIGHGYDSSCLLIGREYCIEKAE